MLERFNLCIPSGPLVLWLVNLGMLFMPNTVDVARINMLRGNNSLVLHVTGDLLHQIAYLIFHKFDISQDILVRAPGLMQTLITVRGGHLVNEKFDNRPC